VLAARVYASRSKFQDALGELDRAIDTSTRRGGVPENRALLTRIRIYVKWASAEPSRREELFALAYRDAEYAANSDAVPSGFRPAFRNELAKLLWIDKRFDEAYEQSVRACTENR